MVMTKTNISIDAIVSEISDETLKAAVAEGLQSWPFLLGMEPLPKLAFHKKGKSVDGRKELSLIQFYNESLSCNFGNPKNIFSVKEGRKKNR
jgi:hypothetical protein